MHKYSLFSIIKEGHLYSWKNFRGTREKRESLAQQIFHRLRYIHKGMGVFLGMCAECPPATNIEYVNNTCIVAGH